MQGEVRWRCLICAVTGQFQKKGKHWIIFDPASPRGPDCIGMHPTPACPAELHKGPNELPRGVPITSGCALPRRAPRSCIKGAQVRLARPAPNATSGE